MKSRLRASIISALVIGGALVAAGGAGCGGDANGPRVDPTGVGGSGGNASPAVVATIDVSQRHQELVGFGAAVAFYTNYLSVRTDDIFTVLFNDLGLDLLRIGNWYQNQPATGTTTASPFTDNAGVAIVQKATAALGHPPKILMSSWSPPSYLKSNAATKPTKGSLVQNAGVYPYDQLGQWWVSALQAYADKGVVPDYISIQNEPDYFNAGWETCLFDAVQGTTNAGYGPALDAVYSAIQGSTLDSKPAIIGPETTGISNSNVQKYLANMNVDQLVGVAHHLYSGGAGGSDPAPDSFGGAMGGVADAASAAGKPVFMTEFAPSAPNMFDTAWLIHDALVSEGVSAYFYWDLIWAPPAAGASPSGLVTIASGSPTSAYTINDLYYAVKHFARWTDPGWIRVDATATDAAIKLSAFQSPDGLSLTVVLLNTDTTDRTVNLDAGSFAFGSSNVYRTSGSSERTAAMPLGDGSSVALPARSIATVTFGP